MHSFEKDALNARRLLQTGAEFSSEESKITAYIHHPILSIIEAFEKEAIAPSRLIFCNNAQHYELLHQLPSSVYPQQASISGDFNTITFTNALTTFAQYCKSESPISWPLTQDGRSVPLHISNLEVLKKHFAEKYLMNQFSFHL
jgi:hypothetical protein